MRTLIIKLCHYIKLALTETGYRSSNIIVASNALPSRCGVQDSVNSLQLVKREITVPQSTTCHTKRETGTKTLLKSIETAMLRTSRLGGTIVNRAYARKVYSHAHLQAISIRLYSQQQQQQTNRSYRGVYIFLFPLCQSNVWA